MNKITNYTFDILTSVYFVIIPVVERQKKKNRKETQNTRLSMMDEKHLSGVFLIT